MTEEELREIESRCICDENMIIQGRIDFIRLTGVGDIRRLITEVRELHDILKDAPSGAQYRDLQRFMAFRDAATPESAP